MPKPDVESETIFKTLVGRNAINMHAQAQTVGIIYVTDSDGEVAQKIKGFLGEVGLKNEFA